MATRPIDDEIMNDQAADPTPTTDRATTSASVADNGPAQKSAPQSAPGPGATMRAVVARRYGTPEVLALEDVPVPTPGKGQVLVAVEASSLNALDWHLLTGTPYLVRPSSGLLRPRRGVPGADVAGTVVAVGPEVEGLIIGDAVFGETSGGGCAPYAVLSADNLALKPSEVSFTAAAATPVAGLTALQAIVTHGAVEPGDRVLINGAAGGVGTFAVQIAVALGAEVTAVCSTAKVDMVAALGATEVIDYRREDVAELGRRFEVMVDNVGNHSPSTCLSLLEPNGRYVAVSGPKDNRWLGPVPHIVRTALAFWRAEPSFHQFVANANRADLTTLGEMLADGRLTPEIQEVIGLDGVADALVEIGGGHTRAKIVVTPN